MRALKLVLVILRELWVHREMELASQLSVRLHSEDHIGQTGSLDKGGVH
jgi:hypothetical protein